MVKPRDLDELVIPIKTQVSVKLDQKYFFSPASGRISQRREAHLHQKPYTSKDIAITEFTGRYVGNKPGSIKVRPPYGFYDFIIKAEQIKRLAIIDDSKALLD